MSDYRIEIENKQIRQSGIEYFIQQQNSATTCTTPHIHTSVEILYILQGDFKIIADSSEYYVQPGDTVLFRSNTIHHVYSTKNGLSKYLVLKLKPSFILDLSSEETGNTYLLNLALQPQNSKIVWTKEECERGPIATSMHRLMEEAEKAAYGCDIAIKICAAEIILSMLRDIGTLVDKGVPTSERNENLIRQIYDATVFINQHFSDDITAEECSRHVHMSYSYFSRSFKRLTGQTFTDYLNVTRINRAEKALASSKKSITEIAADCGFNNVSYFISKFKDKKGFTPSAYRDNCKK